MLQEDLDSKYDSIMTLEYLDGNVVTNTIADGEGTYELKDDELVLHFEKGNITVKLNKDMPIEFLKE